MHFITCMPCIINLNKTSWILDKHRYKAAIIKRKIHSCVHYNIKNHNL